MENDFEPILFNDHPSLVDVKQTLLAVGAEGVLLAGSGATMFGVFRDQARAMRAKEAFAGIPEYRVAIGPSLRHGVFGPS